MDTITHGIAGALIAKAAFRGQDMLGAKPMNRARIITWSLMLGAIFPDSDVFRDFFSHNDLLILTWHRSITHSLLCLPIFSVLLAALTLRLARWRKWDAPSFAALTAIYGVGILSHILLDLVTSFGTMIWSPAKWSRPAWDLIFIVDFTLSAILLVPQIAAWVYSKEEGLRRRALGSWLAFAAATVVVAFIAVSVNAALSLRAIFVAMVVLAAVFLLPRIRRWGLRWSLSSWNMAGLLAALGYIGAAAVAQHVALVRVDNFASSLHLNVQSRGALPLPPSLWQWDGLVLTPRGVYELRMELGGESSEVKAANGDSTVDPSLSYRFYPDAAPNAYIEAARRLPEVGTVLWFARFPVTRFHREGSDAVVEFSDLRFPQMRPGRPSSFTYRVRLAADQTVLSQGWIKPK
ncbi:MAG TPA: metal-dependent hydrolase [Candidatus Acidoferrum sp.]|nr:metal-dependent hydrolase [Candidatus Acidoferrum sp.]